MSEIIIQYKGYIPATVIEQMQASGIESELESTIIPFKKDEKYYYAEGLEVADIIIRFAQDHSHLLFEGLLAHAAWDAIKATVKIGWRSLHSIPEETPHIPKVSDRSMAIKIKDGKKSVEIEIKGDLNDGQIDKGLDLVQKYLPSKEFKTDYANPEYQEVAGEIGEMKMTFDPKSGLFLPVNYGENRKFFEQVDKELKKMRD